MNTQKWQLGIFKTRLGVIAGLLGLSFTVSLTRLWQLQVTRYEKYNRLATRDISVEKMVPAIRAPIYDRCGDLLAYDQPFFDLSVRVERLPLEMVSLADVADAWEKFPDPGAREAREAEFERLRGRLCAEPFVRDLAKTTGRDEQTIAGALFKALDAVARKRESPHTPLKIVSGVDEKIWLGLRSVHEDAFRDSYRMLGKAANGLSDAQEPPFPGLVCTISKRRVYPNGRQACFLLGYVGELNANDEDAVRTDGILLEHPEIRRRQWEELRSSLDSNAAARLETVLNADPREMTLGQAFTALSNLRPSDRQQAAALGLAEAVRWTERPARMVLAEPEALWLGVGLPPSTHKNTLPDHWIGYMGVERVRNDWLRGKAGMKLRDENDDSNSDDEMRYLHNSQPREGSPLALTISIPWQRAVEKALQGQEHFGAVVVLDVKSGDVLAMASFPDFDPNLFVPPHDDPQAQAQIADLLHDTERRPLTNRAISQQYPLGSVMKTIIAAVALEKGLLNPNETIECRGCMTEGGQKFHCDDSRAHGTVNLAKALRCSCNMYFMQMGARIGVENLAPYAHTIMGRRSGIDLPMEASGVYPDRDWRMKNCANDPSARLWTRGKDYLLAIGQGQMACTVLQAAQLMAAIANDGSVVTPHVWLDAPAIPPRSLGISSANLAIVRSGLEEVVNVGTPGAHGTAYTPFHELGELSIRVAGKTSTAEHTGGKPHAWFAGYAPADNPQIAFAVLLEEAGHGGATAAPVAYQFLREMYGTKRAPVRRVAGE